MKPLYTIVALAATALLTACANPAMRGAGPLSAAKADEHAAHHAPAASPAAPPPAMQERMKNMQALRDKMMNARTPAERQALMAEHMKAMHEGMDMMNGMKGMGGMPGMKSPPADPARLLQMMEMRMDMMQTMMEMMMQRMPGSTPPPASQ
jgi:predicted small secreted protein